MRNTIAASWARPLLTGLGRAREVRSQGFSPQAFRRFTAPVAGRLHLAVALQVVATAVLLGPYVGIWLVAREVLAGGQEVWFGAAVVVISALLGFLLRLAAYALTHSADVIVSQLLLLRVADHLTRVPLGWFTGKSGQALAALRGVDDLHFAVAHGRLDVVAATVAPALTLAGLFLLDWRLTLVLLVAPLTAYVLSTRALSGAPEIMQAVPKALVQLTEAATRMVRDIATLRLAGRKPEAAVVAAADSLQEALTHSVKMQEIRGGRANALVAPALTLTLVLAVGISLMALGTLTLVELLPFLLFAIPITALQRLPESTLTLRTGYAAALRLNSLLEIPALSQTREAEKSSGFHSPRGGTRGKKRYFRKYAGFCGVQECGF